jgi:hypothetical protein
VAIRPQIARIVPIGNIKPRSPIRQAIFSRAGFFVADAHGDRRTTINASSHRMILARFSLRCRLKLRVFSGKAVCSIPERHGFLKVRQRGSQIVMQLRFEGGTTTGLSQITPLCLNRRWTQMNADKGKLKSAPFKIWVHLWLKRGNFDAIAPAYWSQCAVSE